MKKKYFLLVCAVFLSGCTMKTEEIRPEKNTKADLNFNLQNEPASNQPPQTPPQAPPQSQPLTPPPTSMNQNQDQKSGKNYAQAPAMTIRSDRKYTASLKTDLGDIDIELFADRTPITVNNFVFLARERFYDNTIFHRVIKGFMIQGGDPEGTGRGGPGYQFDDEPFEGEYTRGTVAMANAGPDTNGSQFFVMHQNAALSPNYVIFGQVTAGMDIVDKIAEAAVQPGPNGENSQPVAPVQVRTVTIEEKE